MSDKPDATVIRPPDPGAPAREASAPAWPADPPPPFPPEPQPQAPDQRSGQSWQGGPSGGGLFGASQPVASGGPLAPGVVLSSTFEIEALVARGGMGEVYRARHRITGDPIAIKTIRPELAGDAKIAELFKREAQALRGIRHPAIVSYEGVFDDGTGQLYIAMEFVDGPSLSRLMQSGPLSPADIRRLRDRVADGLAAAHAQGVIHRDLSPDNVILPDGRIDAAKLIDFGIARQTESSKATVIGNDFAGKYSYAAPEQLGLQGGDVGPRADIYSLGLVLAAAAIGTPLDMGNALPTAVQARMKVPDLSRVPEELRAELAAMLQPNPDDRPQSMAELVNRGGATGRRKSSAKGAIPDGARRGAGPMIAGIAAAVLVLLGGGAYVLKDRLFPPEQGPSGTTTTATTPPTGTTPPAGTTTSIKPSEAPPSGSGTTTPSGTTPSGTAGAPPSTPPPGTPPAMPSSPAPGGTTASAPAGTAPSGTPLPSAPSGSPPAGGTTATAPSGAIPPGTPSSSPPPGGTTATAPSGASPSGGTPAASPSGTTPSATPSSPPTGTTTTAAATPPTTTPTPPPDVMAAIQGRMDALVKRFRCAELAVRVDADRTVGLKGYVESEGDRDELVAAARAIEGVRRVDAGGVTVQPWPLCELVRVAAGTTTPDFRVLPNKLDRPYKIKVDRVKFKVLVPSGRQGSLNVVFLNSDRTAWHHEPWSKIRLRAGQKEVAFGETDQEYITLAPPPGKMAIIAVISAEPLFAQPQPEEQDTETYLAELKRALTRQPGAIVSYVAFDTVE